MAAPVRSLVVAPVAVALVVVAPVVVAVVGPMTFSGMHHRALEVLLVVGVVAVDG